ncbi:MAG: SDR family NAD(P)-dependent oxidoreductase [Pseudomonadota bacterium]
MFAAITRSTGGIGNAITRQFFADGWGVSLSNRNSQKAEYQKRQLPPSFPDAVVELYEADFADALHTIRVTQDIQGCFPSIDALYNNSGVLTLQRVNSAQS